MVLDDIWRCVREKDAAILLGNGIHLHINSAHEKEFSKEEIMPSWNELIRKTAERMYLTENLSRLEDEMLNKGISYPEAFSLITTNTNSQPLHQTVADMLSNIPVNKYIKTVAKTLQRWGCPVITTNFDNSLEDSLGINGFHLNEVRSPYYPVNYCSTDDISKVMTNLLDSFSIWHCNGLISFPLSLRLNLYDYCNYIGWLKWKIPTKEGKPRARHLAEASWLSPFFRKKLVIIGLGLSLSETFLRWLLLAKYNSRGERGGDEVMGYYLYAEEDEKRLSDGTLAYLISVGITPCKVGSWRDLYSELFGI